MTPWTDAPGSTSISAKPGDTVQYLLTFKNTGNTQIGDENNGVIIQDYLSDALLYQTESTMLKNASFPNWSTLKDNWIGTNMNPGDGQDIGYYTAGSNAGVQFSAKVPDASKLVCGINNLENVAMLFTPSNGTQLSTANVRVDNKCEKPCPTNPTVPADSPACQPCPTNPDLPSTSDQCKPKPCPTNPDVSIDSKECKPKPCPTNPDVSIDSEECKCKWDDSLLAGDKKCVGPGDDGFALPPSATVSLVLFLILAGIMVGGLIWYHRKSSVKNR
jgi:uncharacterized repeat protein (TIGR01451 family)